MRLTREMCFAAGRDAANRSMRQAGRKAWNEDDFNAAAEEYERLLPFVNCNYEAEAAQYELATRAP